MLILVVGPSGAGKDTLLNGAREALADAPVRFVRRIITRPPNPGPATPSPLDLGAEAHESITPEAFALRQQAGDFALHWHAHGFHYAIPADISLDLARGRAVVANVSRAVLAEAAARFPVAVIEVTAPPEILAARLAARARETQDDVARRLARGIELRLAVDREVIQNDTTPEEGTRRFVAAIRTLAATAPP